MAISRMTQSMMLDRSYLTLQTVQGRLAKTQEQLTTGRVLNRPSDSPTGTSSAMLIRASIADETQFQRNAQDGLGWLGQIDSALTSSLDQLRRARDLGVQGVNATNDGNAAIFMLKLSGPSGSNGKWQKDVDYIRIDLPAPRSQAMRHDAPFNRLCARVRAGLDRGERRGVRGRRLPPRPGRGLGGREPRAGGRVQGQRG